MYTELSRASLITEISQSSFYSCDLAWKISVILSRSKSTVRKLVRESTSLHKTGSIRNWLQCMSLRCMTISLCVIFFLLLNSSLLQQPYFIILIHIEHPVHAAYVFIYAFKSRINLLLAFRDFSYNLIFNYNRAHNNIYFYLTLLRKYNLLFWKFIIFT